MRNGIQRIRTERQYSIRALREWDQIQHTSAKRKETRHSRRGVGVEVLRGSQDFFARPLKASFQMAHLKCVLHSRFARVESNQAYFGQKERNHTFPKGGEVEVLRGSQDFFARPLKASFQKAHLKCALHSRFARVGSNQAYFGQKERDHTFPNGNVWSLLVEVWRFELQASSTRTNTPSFFDYFC